MLSEVFAPLYLAVHLLFVAAISWLLLRQCLPETAGDLEYFLGWGSSFIAVIAGIGVVLGAWGGLGAKGYWAGEIVALILLLWARRSRVREDGLALRRLMRRSGAFLGTGRSEAVLAAGLILLLAGMALLAFWAKPVIYDAMTYRLPRIGQWLQDGRIGLIQSDDPRLNYMPVVPDLMISWLITALPAGFRLAGLAQLLGGVLTVGATVGLARETGLGRCAALGAGLLLFGMANVVPQFTSGQTDLFTTGVFVSAFYLWMKALRRGEGSVVAGLGAGLALGSKGTLFYLAPGALIWVVWLAWRHPLSRSQWGRTLAGAVVGIGIFAAPLFLRNFQTYGGPFGPPSHVRMHHGTVKGAAAEMRKLQLNLRSTLVQALEPNSQPGWLREPARKLAEFFAGELPERDEYILEGTGRREILLPILARARPDADVTSFGAISLVFFSAGFFTALARRRRAGGALVIVWCAGVTTFLVFFDAMQQWHPFGFRYFVLVAPWIAIVTAWWLEGLAFAARISGWLVIGLAGLGVLWNVTMHTHQSGWQAVFHPERSRNYLVLTEWRAWSAKLDERAAPLRIALPDRRPIAAFYRQAPARPVALRHLPADDIASAEQFVGKEKGWVIFSAGQFLGREGRVRAETFLFDGDELSPFSLAAYRKLGPGEEPSPVLYRKLRNLGEREIDWDLLIKTWGHGPATLQLINPDATAVNFVVSSPTGQTGGKLDPFQNTFVTLDLPADEVSQVVVVFQVPAGSPPGPLSPTVELRR